MRGGGIGDTDRSVSDLLVILVLGIVGLAARWWRVRDARRALNPYLDSQRMSGFAKGMMGHPDAQIFVALLAMIACFWVATASIGGLRGDRKTAFGQKAPPAKPNLGDASEAQAIRSIPR